MNSRDITGLYEAYLGVYQGDDLYEANKAEKEMNLTSKQRSRLRNVSYKQEYTTPSQRRDVYSNASNLDDSDKARLLHPHDRGDQRATQKWHKQIATKRKEEHQNKQRNEDLDIYDLVLDHLLDEGYCDDVESAEVIMANMGEEWVDEIIEGFVSPFKTKPTYGNPRGTSPAMKALQKSDELQRTELGSPRQKAQTRRSNQLNRLFHAAADNVRKHG